MSVTIKQIAEYAGTSRGTVDKVLHNRPGVKESTRQRVLEIIKELDYRPNIIGKALVMNNRSLKIGIIVTPDENYYIQQVLLGIHAAFSEFSAFGITLSIKALTSFEPDEEIMLLDALVQEGCAGIAVFPIDHPKIIKKVNELGEQGIAIITFNSRIEKINNLCFIGQDNLRAGRTAASLMGRILAPDSELAVIISSRILSCHALRLGGFREKLQACWPTLRIKDIAEAFDDDDKSYEQTIRLCEKYPNLKAIYVTGGGSTGVCKALDSLKLSKEVKVICHDICPASAPYLQSGTIAFSIEQDGYEQGYQLVKVLFEYLIKCEAPKSYIQAPLQIVTEELI